MQTTVLHLIPSLSGGGAERQLALLARALAQAGLRVHLGYLYDGPNSQAAHADGVVLHRLPAFGNHDPLLLRRVLRLIRTTRADLVQTWLPQMDVIGGLAARWTAVPVILTERSSAGAYAGSLKDALRLRIGRRSAAVVANSQSGLEYWRAQGYAGRGVVIRNGVVAAAAVDDSSIGTPRERIILFVGRLSPEKNLPRLIAALDQVLRGRQEYVAILCGEGPQRAELERQITTLPTRDRIRLAGFRTDLEDWMRRAAVFVSASAFEGHPNAVLEAMMLGCPLVVSDIPQHREILDERSAVFCSPDSSADIAAGIERALDDAAASRARVAAARLRAAGCSVDAASAAYVELYTAILCEQQRNP
jgi:glycosyltransferase involved in cell wall biosynthesis